MIAFTAGIGENSSIVRELICTGLDYLGLELDKNRNDNFKRGVNALISSDKSKVKAYVIPTNEELVIARETVKYGVPPRA
jgi:acetate kinase